MKQVNWKDDKGHIHRSIIPDLAGESQAPFGVPNGPPDINQLDWDAIKMEMNNALAGEGIWTWEDAQRNPNGVGAALVVVKRHLIALYRDDWKPTKTKLGG